MYNFFYIIFNYFSRFYLTNSSEVSFVFTYVIYFFLCRANIQMTFSKSISTFYSRVLSSFVQSWLFIYRINFFYFLPLLFLAPVYRLILGGYKNYSCQKLPDGVQPMDSTFPTGSPLEIAVLEVEDRHLSSIFVLAFISCSVLAKPESASQNCL